MRFFFLMLVALLLLPVTSLAKYVAVLETISDAKDSSGTSLLTLQERLYLTDVLRGQAVKILPAEQNFTIMTRENISVMLPPGTTIEDCEGSCLAETGKNISADYVAQARVTFFGGSLAISAEIYETAGNKLLASFNGRGAGVNELENIIKEQSADFFRKVKGATGGWGGATGFSDIPTYVDADENSIHWIPVGISAATFITGTIIAIVGNSSAKSTYDDGAQNAQEYKSRKNDIHSAQTMRGVGVGIAIVGAVGLGLSFAF